MSDEHSEEMEQRAEKDDELLVAYEKGILIDVIRKLFMDESSDFEPRRSMDSNME